MLASNTSGYFPYTPATTLLYGLREAIAMLEGEGLDNVFARHQRLGDACRGPLPYGIFKRFARTRTNIRTR